MADLFDYLTWRGDLTMEQAPFNEIDGMILARFAYTPFEYFAEPLPKGFVTIRDLAAAAMEDAALRTQERWRLRDSELLPALADTRRFGDLELGFFSCKLDEVIQTQFAAITVRLSEELTAMVFRGTDNTVVGWKEDMNMSFRCPVPGQELAVGYVRRIAEKMDGRLILCGHSKGGNLAVYAGAFCGGDVQRRIDAVYNYDGPGFYGDILETMGYRGISGRIHTYVPQFSVVGMLLSHRHAPMVVHSTESGLGQHDVYSWEVLGPAFVCLEAVTGGSEFVSGTIREWTEDMTPEQFEQFADVIYTVLTDTSFRTMHEMKENWFDTARSFVRSVADMDEQTRDAAMEALKLLARSAGREAKEVLSGV